MLQRDLSGFYNSSPNQGLIRSIPTLNIVYEGFIITVIQMISFKALSVNYVLVFGLSDLPLPHVDFPYAIFESYRLTKSLSMIILHAYFMRKARRYSKPKEGKFFQEKFRFYIGL